MSIHRRQPIPPKPDDSGAGLAASVNELRKTLASKSPAQLAANIGCDYQSSGPQAGQFSLPFFSSPVLIPFPELVARRPDGQPLPLPMQALLLYHLNTSDGSPVSGRWVSFSELPGGRVYNQAYQGYSGDKLVRQFGSRLEAFQQACCAAGGQPERMGDAAFSFQALPRLPLLVTYWLGEDVFPSSAKILFDETAANHLPIDVCAILGSILVSRISKAAPIDPPSAATLNRL